MYEHGKRVITCKNIKNNTSITFNEREFAPFLLMKATGIYDSKFNVSRSENTMIDGSVYQGSIMQTRNIVLNVKDIDNYEDNRDLLDSIFEINSLGELKVTDGDHVRAIEYYVESVSSTATVGKRITTISLICPDPHFYDPNENRLEIANIMAMFEFPHCFVAEGEELSYQNPNHIGEIMNNEAEENTGITIIVKAAGTVVNPSITKIETQEKLKVGTSSKTFTMYAGDIVTITTHTGNKNINYTHSGTTTDINEYLSEDSVYFQLSRGRNSIGYDATSGSEYMQITIVYKSRYARA